MESKATVSDPVCGMAVDPETAEYSSLYESRRYYFCSYGCKQKFDVDPTKYSSPGAGQGA